MKPAYAETSMCNIMAAFGLDKIIALEDGGQTLISCTKDHKEMVVLIKTHFSEDSNKHFCHTIAT